MAKRFLVLSVLLISFAMLLTVTNEEGFGYVVPPYPNPLNSVSILPSYNDASANWQKAGLQSVGGIPSRTIICATVSPLGGSSDDYSNIQSALNSCPSGQVVVLASGNFNILTTDVPIQIPSGIVLRGTGSCTKSSSPYCDTSITVYDGILAYTGGMCGTSLPGSGCPNGGQPMVQMGPIRIDYGYSWAQCGNVGGPHPNALSCGAVSLAADAAQGATTIQVTQTSGFSVGDWTLIDEASGAGWVTDPMDAWTGFGQVWAASDWLSSSGSPATGRVLWSKSLNAPGWDFGAYYVTGGISGTTFTTAPQNVGIAL